MKRMIVMNRTGVMVALLLCAAAAGGGYAHLRMMQQRMQTLAQLQSQMNELKAKVDASTAAERLAMTEQALEGFDRAIPRQDEVANVLETFSLALAQFGVTQRSVTSGVTVVRDGLGQTPVQVSYQGTFHSVFDLLCRVEKADRVVRLEQLSLRQDPSSPQMGLTVIARFNTFNCVWDASGKERR